MGLLLAYAKLHTARMFRVVTKLLLGCSEWLPGCCCCYVVHMVFLVSRMSVGREDGWLLGCCYALTMLFLVSKTLLGPEDVC